MSLHLDRAAQIRELLAERKELIGRHWRRSLALQA
jgi:hypothetical protein